MNVEQSLALAISIVLCICLTLNSAILAKDLSLDVNSGDDEPWQKGLGARLVTMIIMWCVWLTITFEFIPWSDSAKEQVQRVTDGADVMLDNAEREERAIVDEN